MREKHLRMRFEEKKNNSKKKIIIKKIRINFERLKKA